HHAGDAQSIVTKYALAAALLRGAMVLDVAPRRDRSLIAPEGQRQKLGPVRQARERLEALEAVGADEALHRLQLGAQRGGDVEIGLLVAVGRPYFENDGNHGCLL